MNTCNIIKDILPLYVEDMVSTDTRTFIEKHIEQCAVCRAELEQMRAPAEFAPDTDVTPLKKLKKKLLIKRIQTVCFTAVLVLAIAISVVAILTAPKYFPYSAELLSITKNPDGSMTIAFDEAVTGYSFLQDIDDGTGTETYRIQAWSTTWDIYFGGRGKQNMEIMPHTTSFAVYYVQNNGSEDILICGPAADNDSGTISLPRLILFPYFLFAILNLIILLIVRHLTRGKENITVWIDRLIPFPVSYMLAQFFTKGFNFKSYSSQRDFGIIILVTVLFYCAMLLGIGLYNSRKAMEEK